MIFENLHAIQACETETTCDILIISDEYLLCSCILLSNLWLGTAG